jgi:DNA-binding beta-propeller fold protein YncE
MGKSLQGLGVIVALLVPIQAGPAQAAHQRQLWVTNSQGRDVHVYDVETRQLLRTIEVGDEPHGISATADGRTVHVALESFRSPQGELLWLDARDGRITGRTTVGKLPNECECTPDGRWIYVPCDDGHYWVVDGQTRAVAARIPTGGRPHNTVASPDGRRMYLVPMGAPRRVSIVDVAQGHRVIGEIPFAGGCRPAAVTADGRWYFQQIDDLIGFQVADVEQRQVIATVKHSLPADKAHFASRAHGLAVRPDQKEVWSCNVEHHLVHVHDLAEPGFRETAAVAMPGRVYWVSFTPDSRFGFVSVRSRNQVAVVDCQSKQIVAHLDVGREPKRTQVIDVPQ